MLHDLLRGLVAQSDGGGFAQLLFPLAIVAIMYFLLIRPQSKAAKEQQSLIASLKKGDEVVTSGGLIGRIYAVADKTVTLEVANGVRIRIVKSFVQARQVSEEAEAKKEDAPVAEKAAEKKEGK